MKDLNSRFLTRTTLAALACAGLAFGCVNNGSDEAYRDDQNVTTPDTTSGTTSSAYDASTVSGTTAAPATAPAANTGTTATTGTTGATGTTATAPTTGTTGSAAGTTAGSHGDHSAMTPDQGTKTADAKKKNMKKKMEKKTDKPAEGAKTDSSSTDDFGAAGTVGMHGDENLSDEAGTEEGDSSLASMPNEEEEATVSGTTTSDIDSSDDATVSGSSSPATDTDSVNTETPAATNTTMTSSPDTQSTMATRSASEEDLKRSAKMAGALSPWYHEPYSRIPTHVGSTTITGKDKSLAALESYNVFIDPPALERARLGREAIRPVGEIDFGSFGYDRRNRFAAQMNSRLANIDSRIDVLEAKPELPKAELQTVENDHEALENQLEDIRKIDEANWISFRDGFRDRLTALESEVARLSVSR